MKKNNKKGFTLVELVVVATIMVMIMGSILNWIRPMNKFYDRTRAMADTNDIGSILMDYVDDELRYTTNVVILQGYKGVPKLTGGYLMNTSNKASYSAKFTNALIIDNDAVRGSQFEGYDPNSNASHRKGATGCIIKANITEKGIDVKNLRCLGTEPIYNDYGCHFDASLKTLDNKSQCVTIDMSLSRPRREGGSYVFDKVGYNQSRDFELVNVNLTTDAEVKVMKAASFGAPIDYTQFASSSDIGTLSGDNYTYILYTKEPVTTEQVTVTLLDKPGSNLKLDTPRKVTSGASIGGIIDSWKNNLKSQEGMVYENGQVYMKKFVKIYAEGVDDIEIYRTTGVTTDLDCYPEFSYIQQTSSEHSFYFIDRFSSDNKDVGEFERVAAFFPAGSNEVADGKFSDDPQGYGDAEGKYIFVGWNTTKNIDLDTVDPPSKSNDPDEIAKDLKNGWFVSGQIYTEEMKYFAIYKTVPTKTVKTPDGKQIEIKTNKPVSEDPYIQQLIQDAIDNTPTDPPNQEFLYLEVIDNSTGESKGRLESVFDELDDGGDYTIKAKYDVNNHPGYYDVTIKFDADKYETWNKLHVQYNGGVGNSGIRIQIYDEDGTTLLGDSNNVTWHYEYPQAILKGTTLKIRVVDNAQITLTYNNKSETTSSEAYYVHKGALNNETIEKIG